MAQGRVWTGEQAIERGLVDALGGLSDALEKAAELEDLSSYGVVRFPEHKTLLEVILEDFSNSDDGQSNVLQNAHFELQFPDPMKQTIDHALMLDRILDGYGAAAILPGHLSID